MNVFFRNRLPIIFYLIFIMIFHGHGGEVFMKPSKSTLLFNRDSGDSVSLVIEVSERNVLRSVIIQYKKIAYTVPDKHMHDIVNPELYTIAYTEHQENGELVSQIELSHDRRIYTWGSSTSKVVYYFKNYIYHGRELVQPVGETKTKSEFQKAPNNQGQ
jgi:hypothetical protein